MEESDCCVWADLDKMESCPGTKLNKHTAFSYKSFGSPSEFTDESPSIDSKQDLKSKHGERKQITLANLIK